MATVNPNRILGINKMVSADFRAPDRPSIRENVSARRDGGGWYLRFCFRAEHVRELVDRALESYGDWGSVAGNDWRQYLLATEVRMYSDGSFVLRVVSPFRNVLPSWMRKVCGNRDLISSSWWYCTSSYVHRSSPLFDSLKVGAPQ